MTRKQSVEERTELAAQTMLPKAIAALTTPALGQATKWYSVRCDWILHKMQHVSGMNAWQCSVILAALSANTKWDINVRRAIAAAEYIGRPDQYPFPGGMPYHVNNILWAGANPRDPARKLTGRKTLNFAKAIFGDENAVTVDLWMCKAAEIKNRNGDPITNPGQATHYDVVENAVVKVSDLIGLSPRDTQALIWIAVRGSAN